MKLSDRMRSGNRLIFGLPHEVVERPNLKGAVHVEVEENDRRWLHHSNPNLIVNGARGVMANILATPLNTYRISQIKLGDGGLNALGADPTIEANIREPLVTETDLNQGSPVTGTYVYTHAPNGLHPEYDQPPVVTSTSVKFTFEIDRAQGNNTGSQVYTEAGLFTEGGTLFAIETFVALVKNGDRKIIFTWTILF